MSKKTRRSSLSDVEVESSRREIILDEGFIMCASGCGCESKNCKGTLLDCEFMALRSLVESFARKYLLVVDDQYKVKNFYSKKVEQGKISKTIEKLIFKWLDGRGDKVRKYKIQPLPEKIMAACPSVAKEKKLDMLLCQLALASKAPIWTLDSDFDCAHEVNSTISPMDPVDVWNTLFPKNSQIKKISQ